MGRSFGHLGCRVNGVIYYSLSPHEQKAFAGFFKKGIPNTIRRLKGTIVPFVIPSMLTGILYTWCQRQDYLSKRKNPKDYEHEV